MPDLKKTGLIEALDDFGVDMGWEGLDCGLTAVPTIQLQDIALNYEPSLRARGFAVIDQGAGGAGNTSAASIQAQNCGMWLTQACHLAAGGFTTIFVTNAPYVTAGIAGAIMLVGGAPGQIDQGPLATSFFGPAGFLVSSTIATAPQLLGAIRIDGRRTSMNVNQVPLWIPGNAFLNIAQGTANAQLLTSIELQFPSASVGKWP